MQLWTARCRSWAFSDSSQTYRCCRWWGKGGVWPLGTPAPYRPRPQPRPHPKPHPLKARPHPQFRSLPVPAPSAVHHSPYPAFLVSIHCLG